MLSDTMFSGDEESFGEVLAKNYDSLISDHDRIYILAIFGRLRRILNWDTDYNEMEFDRNRGPAIIEDLMYHFTRWKSSMVRCDNLTEVIGLQHLITYSLATLCFYYWIENSSIVAEALRHVYFCDGHFSSMFSHIVNLNNRTLRFEPAEKKYKKENLTMLFFLAHANHAKLLFDNLRFVDLSLQSPIKVPPAFLAAIYSKPHQLLLLLRYGAVLEPRPNGSDDWDIYMLLRHLIRIMWASLGNRHPGESWDTALISNTLYDVWQSLQVLLRAILQIEMGQLEFTIMNFDTGGLTVTGSSHDFIRHVSERGIVSKLACRYLSPCELQHSCRCAVRRVLNQNWNLPFGIFKLPVPTLLQHYLNLSED